MTEHDPFNGAHIGCHASITPTILDAIKYISAIGGNALQIFAGSNRSSGLSTKQQVSDHEATEIRNLLQERNIYLNIHAIYLLNFCTAGPKSPRLEYARANLEYDIQLAQRIGAKSVVLHLGNHLNKYSIEDAESNQIANVVEVLRRTFKKAPDVTLLLETPAGQGTQIATTLPSLARVFNGVRKALPSGAKHKRRIGICLDTAHVFSSCTLDTSSTSQHISNKGQSGKTKKAAKKTAKKETKNQLADISSPQGWDDYLAEFDRLIDIKHLRLIHLNDSKRPLCSRRDMHEGIGDGYIFRKTLDNATKQPTTLHHIINTARHHHIPIILETHKAAGPTNTDTDLYAQELGLLATIANNPREHKLVHKWRLIHPSSTHKTPKHSTHKKHGSTRKLHADTKPGAKSGKKPTQKRPQRGDHYGANPSNTGIIERLAAIRDYYNLPSVRDRIRQLAYARAVVALQNYPEEIRNGDQVRMLDGIGAKIALKIDQFLQNGEMRIIQELPIRQELAKAERERGKGVEAVLGIGPTKASVLSRQGIKTVAELQRAVSRGKVALAPAIQIALEHHEDLMKKIPIKEARQIVSKIKKVASGKHRGELEKHKLDIELAGSFAAGATESKDVDILIIARKYQTRKNMPVWPITDDLRAALLASGMVVGVLNVGKAGKLTILVRAIDSGLVRHVDIRIVAVEEEVTARMYFTSGRMFNQVVRGRAKSMGYKLNEFGLFNAATGRRIDGIDSEKAVLEKLGLDFIPLEKRRG